MRRSILPLARRIVAALVVTLATTATASAGLVNGGFEQPVVPPGVNFAASIPGWTSNDQFEIWTSGTFGVPAFQGNQFVELNANIPSTIFQDVAGITGGAHMGFQFAHRGRFGADTMRFTMTDLGADNAPGGVGANADTVLFTNTYTDGTAAWGFYTQTSPVVALGNTIRFSYQAVASVGGGSIGNFLDAADFTILPAPPALIVALLIGVTAAGFGYVRRRRLATEAC